MAGKDDIERLKIERDAALTVCAKILRFWGSHEAWGDHASLTRATGAFAPIADAAREALAFGQCDHCGKPASCYGRYEGIEGFGCDECCGHGNEDGWCVYVSDGLTEDEAVTTTKL